MHFFQENFRYDKTVPNFVLKHIWIESFKVTPHKKKQTNDIFCIFAAAAPSPGPKSDIDSYTIKEVKETVLIGWRVKGWCVFWEGGGWGRTAYC